MRTALGVAFITFYLVNLINGAQRPVRVKLDISLNVMTWAGRIAVDHRSRHRLCGDLPAVPGSAARRPGGARARHRDRHPQAAAHGEFIEVHQPLGAVDDHGHPIPLAYQGAPVPKRMNQLGSAGAPVPGSTFRPDPAEQTRALEEARHDATTGNGVSPNGSKNGRGEGGPPSPPAQRLTEERG